MVFDSAIPPAVPDAIPSDVVPSISPSIDLERIDAIRGYLDCGEVNILDDKEPFDPEGFGYDYETATNHGFSPDSEGHWPSRVPETGQLLKGRGH